MRRPWPMKWPGAMPWRISGSGWSGKCGGKRRKPPDNCIRRQDFREKCVKLVDRESVFGEKFIFSAEQIAYIIALAFYVKEERRTPGSLPVMIRGLLAMVMKGLNQLWG